MKFLRIVVLSFMSLTSASYGNEVHDVNIEKLEKLKKIDKNDAQKILDYCDNPLAWSALNYSIEVDDLRAALLIVDYTMDINRKDCAYSLKPSKHHHQINALQRVLYRASFIHKQKSLSDHQQMLVRKLIDKGIQVDQLVDFGQGSPTVYLCMFNEVELVKELLDRGVDINQKSGRLLSSALACGYVEMVHMLLDQGADVNLIDMLHSSILGQKCELIQLALDLGCNIHKTDVVRTSMNYVWSEAKKLDGNIPCNLQALECLHFLLTNGADPNFWIQEAINDNKSPNEVFSKSPLGIALRIFDSEASFQQKWYQQFLINLLLDYGAVIP